VKSFRLSNQCSAGNGMLLQAMAAQFGVDVKDYAEVAFKAGLSPRFSYGCAVFLDTDRVNFQKEGFSKEELFAGLAQVLPKNVWQYVVQIPRMAELGSKYVLQGGTQYNLAAVKAQVDYINERVPNAEVRVHPHTGEAGAIGAALEAKRVVERRGHSTFIGLDEAIDLHYTARTDESTRCTFCDNLCSRTFIDTQLPNGEVSRYIAGFSCEKGTVESQEAVIDLGKERKRLKGLYPNLVDYEANLLFRHFYKPVALPEAGTPHLSEEVRPAWFGLALRRKVIEHGFRRGDEAAMARRAKIRVGIPRALNTYSLAPFLRTYLEVLGLDRRNILFSDQTSEELFHEGGKYGSVDPCYPAKVSLAHVYNLLHPKGNRQPVNYIWFPSVTDMGGFVSHTMGDKSCPVVAGTPMVARAAFTKEKDFFADAGCEYLADALDFTHSALLKSQLFDLWGERLGITRDESDLACEQGMEAQLRADEELQERGLEVLNQAERDNGVVLLMIGRPYHNDPGLNHEILEEFQTLGYPVLSIRAIPKDPGYLQRFFAEDLTSGAIEDVFDIRDVWPENYSVNSAQKVWAAKFAARHPNVAVIDLSSFKCGHDAPTYGIIDKIIATSKTPYLAMHDLDANKPSGSIKIRVKTFSYSLELFREQLQDEAGHRSELERAVAAKRYELVEKRLAELAQQHRDEDAVS
ncbi:MAG TPA: acyl-CoA dehydratase activase-related protein, partial [Gammaproteobacteria bacterium]